MKEEIKIALREYWMGLKRFETTRDIPDLPRVEHEEWQSFFVPKLIECGAIPKQDLVIDKFYIGDHRNAQVAKWDGERFIYIRYKWGSFFEDTCNHFEDDDGYALFVPIKEGSEEQWKENKE